MMNFIKTLKDNGYQMQDTPFSSKNVIEAQKELVKSGYPFLPLEFISFLKSYNGLRGEDSAILGVLPRDKGLDIITFNEIHNGSKDMVILGYDDFCFLVYDELQKDYVLVDRETGDELESFSAEGLPEGLSSILHY
ncbi:MAG: hypothetical protein IKS23_03560 [Alphaproteobacteria bacterium]|nr:hypothetical protein [Alphaproteobacteria bacterium]